MRSIQNETGNMHSLKVSFELLVYTQIFSLVLEIVLLALSHMSFEPSDHKHVLKIDCHFKRSHKNTRTKKGIQDLYIALLKTDFNE